MNKTQTIGGDPAQWVDDHGDYLFSFALGRLRDRNTAEDAVQETFLSALSDRSSYSGQSTLRSWLTGILKHKIADQLRAIYRDREGLGSRTSINNLDDLFNTRGYYDLTVKEWKGDPRRALENEEFWQQLRDCLAKMPKRLAQVFMLREVDGVDVEEICKDCEITTTNYWVILHRARLALRKCVDRHWFRRTNDES